VPPVVPSHPPSPARGWGAPGERPPPAASWEPSRGRARGLRGLRRGCPAGAVDARASPQCRELVSSLGRACDGAQPRHPPAGCMAALLPAPGTGRGPRGCAVTAALSLSVRCLGRCGGVCLQPGGRDQLPDGLQLLPAALQLPEHSGGADGAGGHAG